MNLQVKIGLIVVIVLGSLWSLYPTLRLARGSADMDATKRAELEDGAIQMGLDLKGGMYLVLEVDETQLSEDLDEAEAIDRTITILRDRIDQFGVSEPVIQKEGDHRILVQLPGLQDSERAKQVLGRTARLEFRLVREGNEVSTLVQRLDRALSGQVEEEPAPDETALEDEASSEDTPVDDASEGETSEVTDPGEVDLADAGTEETPEDIFSTTTEPETEASTEFPLVSLLGPFIPTYGGISVGTENEARVKALLARPELNRIMPRDVEFLWGTEELPAQGGGTAKLLYLVETEIRLAGDGIDRAVVTPDPKRPGKLQVSLDLTRRGGLKFGNVTSANVGRKLAIVLDTTVHSAPNIEGPIRGGRASISGGFVADEEAKDLALVLRAGALPVDVRIEEERTVGPSLGRDSVRQGVNSVLIGGALVIVFMVIYYKVAGILATLGLTLTLLFLLGILAQLGLTLTLPGIAGIILTVGMAVDANVLIFERIREELRHGKSVRAAIDSGYAQATRAIVDANITTFIAAFVLYYFGTGPIRGFAVTLAIGILTSMFSALVFTRSMYQLWLRGRAPRSLSI